MAHSRFE
jgi:tRNA(His) guanylyltransferase